MAKARRGGRRGRSRHRGRSAEPPRDNGRAHWRTDGRPKKRFPTADAANRAAMQLRLEEGADLDPYQCPYCEGWHLASRRH